MWTGFEVYYRPTDDQFKELWECGTIVPDTNVLLNIYRYPESAREDLLKVLDRLSTQLWLPHQVALEFQERRFRVVAEQRKVLAALESKVAHDIGQIQNLLSSSTVFSKRSGIDVTPFIKDLEQAQEKLSRKFERIRGPLPDVTADDPLRERIERLFTGKIGEPFTKAEYEQTVQEGSIRYAHHRPPGFKDSDKGESESQQGKYYFSADSEIERRYGDLIIWKQILQYAATQHITHLIFVTDDKKDDWWWNEKAGASKIIGPRPELVEEIRYSAKVQVFYMYSTDTFLKYARNHLGLEVRNESITQVLTILNQEDQRSVLTASRSRLSNIRYLDRIVLDWLVREHPDSKIVHASQLPVPGDRRLRYYIDAYGQDSNGTVTGYVLADVSNFSEMLDLINKANGYYESEKIDRLEIVCTLRQGTDTALVVTRIQDSSQILPEWLSLTVGVLLSNPEEDVFDRYTFNPIYQSGSMIHLEF